MVLFNPGRVVATPAAVQALSEQYVLPEDLLDRHVNGDWGDITDDDKSSNESALADGSRLVSSYFLFDDVKVLIITEAVDDEGSRTHTTLQLSNEY